MTATDAARPAVSGTSRPASVLPGRTHHLAVTAPASATAGSPVDVTVTAQDRWGNTVPTYTGTVELASSDRGDGAAVEPLRHRFTAEDAGTVTFAAPRGVVLVTEGVQTIHASDTRRTRVAGTTEVTVTPVPAPADGLAAAGWGMDLFGTLGDGGEHEYATQDLRSVVGGAVWRSVSAGDSVSAGIRPDGTLWVWGAVGHEVLEVGEPLQLGTDDDWASVDGDHAIKTDGTLWTWEPAEPGFPARELPVQVGTDADWTAVADGTGHVLALKADGTLWSWGDTNHWGQQGNGTTEPVLEPRQVGTDADWASISAHVYQSAARQDGRHAVGLGPGPGRRRDAGAAARPAPAARADRDRRRLGDGRRRLPARGRAEDGRHPVVLGLQRARHAG